MEDALPDVLTQPDYGKQHCPMQDAIASIADKWKLLILIELGRDGTLRFKALQRALAPVSQKVLTGALRELEADGLLERTVFPEVPSRVEYTLTPSAHALLPILAQLHAWAEGREVQTSSVA